MNTILGWLASNGLLVMPLLGLALVLRRWQPERPALVHGLLLLVFLKLLTPPFWTINTLPATQTLASPLSAPSHEGGRADPPNSDSRALPRAFGELESEAGLRTNPIFESQFADAAVDPGSLARPTAEMKSLEPEPPSRVASPAVSLPTSWNWPLILVSLWAAGAMLWLLLVAIRLARFLRLLKHAEPAPTWLETLAQSLADRLGCRNPPPVRLFHGCVAPMLWSWGATTRILLPAALVCKLDRPSVASLLLHELAHYHRRDHWVRYLELAAFAVYWWHPGIWLARRLLREAEEECCDAQVAAVLKNERQVYAAAILATVDFLAATPRPLPVAGSGLSSFHHLRRRLIMLQSETRGTGLRWPGNLALLGLALLALPLGARLTGEPPNGSEDAAQPPRDERPGPGGPERPGGPPPRDGDRRPPEVRRGNRPPPPEGEPGEPGPGPGSRRPGMMAGFGPSNDNAEEDRHAELDRNQWLFEARSEIRLMKIQLRMREEEVREAQERLENAKQRFARLEGLRDSGTVNGEDLQNAREMVNRAEGQLRMRMIAMEEARERIAIAEERLALMQAGKIRVGGFPGLGGMMSGPGPFRGQPPMPEGGAGEPLPSGRPGPSGPPGGPGAGRGTVRPNRGGAGVPGGQFGPPGAGGNEEEVNRLRRELDQLRREVEKLRGKGKDDGPAK